MILQKHAPHFGTAQRQAFLDNQLGSYHLEVSKSTQIKST